MLGVPNASVTAGDDGRDRVALPFTPGERLRCAACGNVYRLIPLLEFERRANASALCATSTAAP